MRVRNVVIITLIISTVALLAACQKKPVREAFKNTFGQTLKKVFGEKIHAAQPNHVQITPNEKGKTNAAVALNRKDLGVLPLSNHVSTTVTVSRNTQCTLTPTLLEGGNLQIILAMETTGADGRPKDMNVARVLTHPGEPFDVSIGRMDLAFTPQIAVQ